MKLKGHGPRVHQGTDPSSCVSAGWNSRRKRGGPSGHDQESLVPGRSSGDRRDMMT